MLRGQIHDGCVEIVLKLLFPLALFLFGNFPALAFERLGGILERCLVFFIEFGERIVGNDQESDLEVKVHGQVALGHITK